MRVININISNCSECPHQESGAYQDAICLLDEGTIFQSRRRCVENAESISPTCPLYAQSFELNDCEVKIIKLYDGNGERIIL